MSTNFMSLDDKVKESKKTIFTKTVQSTDVIIVDCYTPEGYKNVLHIGYDKCYGDVFKCWNDNINYFNLHFGIKGEEFNK